MADEEQVEDAQALKDFDAGFVSEPPPPVKPAQGTPPETKPAAEAAPKAPAQQPEPKAPEQKAAAPEYVQITKDEHATLMAAAAKTASFDGQFSKLFGTMGNLQQTLNRLQKETPAGEKVELNKVSLAKLRESFPEVADLLEGDMAEIFKGLRGTGPADADGATLTAEDMQKAAKAYAVQLQTEALEEDHPTWRDVVGAVDGEGNYDANNEFRKWLATQPADYQTKINETNSAAVISKAIDKFQASKAPTPVPPVPPAPKVAARKAVIQSAIQPKGDGGQPPPPKTADDDFNEGFRTG